MSEPLNSYVIVMRNPDGEIAAQRIQVRDRDGEPVPSDVEREREGLHHVSANYAKTLGWPAAEVLIVGPVSPELSQILYDLIPGERATDQQMEELTARLGTAATNMRKQPKEPS